MTSDPVAASGGAASLLAARRATRLIFLVSGIAMSTWAPMVPYVKVRLGLDDAQLGAALLAFGGGSMLSMPFVGWLAHRLGNRTVIMSAGLLMCLALPVLAQVSSVAMLVGTLLYFGVMLGAVDVAMNAYAVEVERRSGDRLMSGFHGLFSVGGLSGAALLSALLALGLALPGAAIMVAIMLALTVLWLRNGLHDNVSATDVDIGERSRLGMPHTRAWLLGLMCFVSFMAEGAMLDWSAVFLRDVRGVASTSAGFGYACFSVAMAAGRFSGDRLIARHGPAWAVRVGAGLAVAGFLLVASVPLTAAALLGFVLIGLGASNIVPVMFSAAGRLSGTPPAVSIATATTLGYVGLLSGPALIGFVAHASSLSVAFVAVAGLLVLVGLSARMVR
ncbi:MFS transporter [Dyella caseinilytica]|uniref:MFS transporter n=1 Tax=Dyella caseinilytica TaxID=1849581 RepID=A0ABX7GPM9_9GAMM|nr:MFS transporter [Dyella caseinilytica]QRN52200.1 MFS transporter [Dyella caseinilytica]GGA14052.1 MFS transporter [Dyella caseinilytica]